MKTIIETSATAMSILTVLFISYIGNQIFPNGLIQVKTDFYFMKLILCAFVVIIYSYIINDFRNGYVSLINWILNKLNIKGGV